MNISYDSHQLLCYVVIQLHDELLVKTVEVSSLYVLANMVLT